jgi:hypothetical protein
VRERDRPSFRWGRGQRKEGWEGGGGGGGLEEQAVSAVLPEELQARARPSSLILLRGPDEEEQTR